jgi:hypothetical protein
MLGVFTMAKNAIRVKAKVFIDASYEGDLIAAAVRSTSFSLKFSFGAEVGQPDAS